MESFIISNGIPVRINDQGKGDVIVLLHGYLETLEVWVDFAAALAKSFRVITLDMPGHGLSGYHPQITDMDFMADTVKGVLDKCKVTTGLIVGHSMGGYVALAFAKKYPQQTQALCLFSSTPNPDTEEKKQNRDREIELIKAGKVELLVEMNIPRGFANNNVARFSEEIQSLVENATLTEPGGIISCLQGMKAREDMNAFLAGFTQPFLWIMGKADNYIPFEVTEALFEKFPKAQKTVLENSGHNGFLEEAQQSLEVMFNFATEVFKIKDDLND